MKSLLVLVSLCIAHTTFAGTDLKAAAVKQSIHFRNMQLIKLHVRQMADFTKQTQAWLAQSQAEAIAWKSEADAYKTEAEARKKEAAMAQLALADLQKQVDADNAKILSLQKQLDKYHREKAWVCVALSIGAGLLFISLIHRIPMLAMVTSPYSYIAAGVIVIAVYAAAWSIL